jgi:uncharacterized protein with PIN domain
LNNSPEVESVIKKTRFIVDAMLGSLVRWLRLLGYDALYCEIQSDDEILEKIGDRILLTRDRELTIRGQKRGFRVLNPGSGSIRAMLQRLEEELEIQFNPDPDRSLCPQCNAPLMRKNRFQVQDYVPQGSLSKHTTFWQCTNPQCAQVYWQGRHWTRIKKTLRQLKSHKAKE